MKPLCRKVCFGLRLALFALTVTLDLAAIMLIWQDAQLSTPCHNHAG